MSDVAAASPSDGGVVITGSAGGVGFAYAGEFMDRGYDVVICDVKDCSAAAKALTARHPNGRVYHTQCDVSDAKSVEKLGEFAKQKLGTLKYWINNAGVNGGRRALMDVPRQSGRACGQSQLVGHPPRDQGGYGHYGAAGRSYWSHFQHRRKRCQGRRNSRICLLWCHEAWSASAHGQFGEGTR